MPSKPLPRTSRRSPAARSFEVSNSLDQPARDSAADALAKIAKHEAVCAERYSQVAENLAALRTGVEGLYNRFWLAAISCISLLLMGCGVLIRILIMKS